MADPELVKEILIDLGENLESLGYDGVLETLEGNNRIAKAARSCRYDEDVQILAFYLKDVAKTLLREPPSNELEKAKQCLDMAWRELKAALSDEEEARPYSASPQRPMMPQRQAPQLPRRPQQLPPRRK